MSLIRAFVCASCLWSSLALNVPIAHWVGCGKQILPPTRRTPSTLIVVQRVDDHVGLASFSLVLVFVLASVLLCMLSKATIENNRRGPSPLGGAILMMIARRFDSALPHHVFHVISWSWSWKKRGEKRREETRRDERRKEMEVQRKGERRREERGEDKRKRGKKRRAEKRSRSDTMWVCLYYRVWI